MAAHLFGADSADMQEMRGEASDTFRGAAERSPGSRKAADQDKALQECPIRTRFNPKERKDGVIVNVKQHSSRTSRPSTSSDDSRALASYHSSGTAPTYSSGFSCQRLSKVSEKVGLLTHRAAKIASVGGQEFGTLRSAIFEALATTGKVLDNEGANKMVCELWDRMNTTPEVVDPSRYGATSEDQRFERIKRALVALRSELVPRASANESSYNDLVGHGKFYCGADETVAKAALAAARGEHSARDRTKVVYTVEDKLRVLIASAGGAESFGTALLSKSVIANRDLEELWHQMPGDSAIRRLPEEHEAVFDFGDSRISMPRYFADSRREGERHLEAGQLLEVKERNGRVTLTTHAPRRAVVDAPSRLDAICDVHALDAMLNFPHANHNWSKGKAYNHLHEMKRPPDNKMWMEWRDSQAKQRVDEMRDREQNKLRTRLANQQKLTTEAGATFLTIGEVEDEEEAGSLASSAAGGSKSPRGYEVIKAKIPWDARPSPNRKEMERLARKFLPNDLLEAHLLRAGKADGRRTRRAGNRELAFRIAAVGTSEFQLDFAVMVGGMELPPPASRAAERDEDEDFWKDIFEPIPTGKPKPMCPAVADMCGWSSRRD